MMSVGLPRTVNLVYVTWPSSAAAAGAHRVAVDVVDDTRRQTYDWLIYFNRLTRL